MRSLFLLILVAVTAAVPASGATEACTCVVALSAAGGGIRARDLGPYRSQTSIDNALACRD